MDPILLQKQVRDNSDELRAYIKELSSWEDEMKRKESAVASDGKEKSVRSKAQKLDKPKEKEKKPVKRIKSYDYKAWDNFDVDAECEKIDSEKSTVVDEVAAESSDEEEFDVTEEYQTRLRDEATYEKERGNQFVKQQKWREAIACYTHAIACYPKDPIYFANRALCHLKQNDLHSAEADCTSALQFDPKYVKALQRRAAARYGLKQYNEALTDLKEVLKIEPNNKESKKELEKIEKIIANKQYKSTENVLKYIPPKEKPPETIAKPVPKEEQPVKNTTEEKVTKTIEKQKTPEIKIPWPTRPNSKPVKTIQKLPHLRSKTSLRQLEVLEVDENTKKIKQINKPSCSTQNIIIEKKIDTQIIETKLEEIKIERPVPKSSVQFIRAWKLMKNDEKCVYLKNIKPDDLPNIFQDALESDIFCEILKVMEEKFIENDFDVFMYLKYLATVKRFSTLIMFMSSSEKTVLKKLFEYCESRYSGSEEITVLKKKYEI